MEVWKEVPGYKGYYEASDLGRVRSLDRIVYQKNRWGGMSRRIYKGGILSTYTEKTGYISVRLSKNHYSKTYLLHKVIAMTFLNHKPCGHKKVIDHIDNNPKNNKLSNLQIISQRENASKDRFRHGYSSKYLGVSRAHSRSKKWVSNIYIDGRLKCLGYYDKEYDAHLAYQKALKSLHNDKI